MSVEDVNDRHIGCLELAFAVSDMKYNSIAVQAGIPINNRYEIPASMIPADGNVEIEAKIQAGYFSNRVVTADQLQTVVGRSWEDTPH